MTKKVYTYKGKGLSPLTQQDAELLDKGDKIKFIGEGKFQNEYGGYGSRPVYKISQIKQKVRNAKGEISSISIRDGWGGDVTVALTKWALIEKGDPFLVETRKAERLVPLHLNAVKRDLDGIVNRAKTKIDRYLSKVPLHKKLALFQKLSTEEKAIYDFLYKDSEEVLGLKGECKCAEQNCVA